MKYCARKWCQKHSYSLSPFTAFSKDWMFLSLKNVKKSQFFSVVIMQNKKDHDFCFDLWHSLLHRVVLTTLASLKVWSEVVQFLSKFPCVFWKMCTVPRPKHHASNQNVLTGRYHARQDNLPHFLLKNKGRRKGRESVSTCMVSTGFDV